MTTPVAWVTGAGRGIGAATAALLIERGWAVWATDLDLSGAPRGAEQVPADVADSEAMSAIAARIADRHGALDALVAGAAVFPRRSFADTTAAAAAAVLSTNVVGVIAAITAAAAPMRASGGGSIVVLTSGAAFTASARSALQRGFAEYGASKAALERWVLGVCDELAEWAIDINLLCPGVVVETAGTVSVLSAAERSGARSPEDIAPAVVRLCERDERRATGGRYLATDFEKSWW